VRSAPGGPSAPRLGPLACGLLLAAVLGFLGSSIARSALLTRAQDDLSAEFDRRAQTALAAVEAEIADHEQRLLIIASFAGTVEDLTPAAWARFVEDTGILESSVDSTVGFVSVVRPEGFRAHIAEETRLGSTTPMPIVLPERIGAGGDLFVLTRVSSAAQDIPDIPALDIGVLPFAREALEQAVVDGSVATLDGDRLQREALAMAAAVEAILPDIELDPVGMVRALQRSIGERTAGGILVPVRAQGTGPVIGFVMTGTLPDAGIARIAGSMSDIEIVLSVAGEARTATAPTGERDGAEVRRAEVDGTIGTIGWTAAAVATPAFEDRLDPVAADLTAMSLLLLTAIAMLLLVVRHVHARRAAAAQARLAGAEAQAGRDGLTGLSNRIGLDTALRKLIDGRPRPVAVVFVDLDGLKGVNDTHGHDAGDALIREAARRLRRSGRRDDLVARLGGDEFVLLAPGLGEPDLAVRLARSVLESFAEPVVGPRGVLVEGIRASAGVAIAADPGEVADALVRADLAMYTAKSEGGSSVVLDASVVVDEGRHRAARSEVKAGAPHAED
jgi:diguanylate cyclase (GGDEF)-like protein